VIGLLAKCLQILEIGHLKNNFQGIQKATKRKILVAFLFFIIYKFNAAFIETANKSVAIVLATSNVNGRVLSLIIFLTLFHVVPSLILFKKSCPSQVNEPTEKSIMSYQHTEHYSNRSIQLHLKFYNDKQFVNYHNFLVQDLTMPYQYIVLRF
jgi:hypothetical protein